MKEEKEIPKTYYEKILVTSGEVPEENGWYITDEGGDYYRAGFGGGWFDNEYDPDAKTYPEWYLKPVPSPKQEALDFYNFMIKRAIRGEISTLSLSDLYDKHKLQMLRKTGSIMQTC